MNVMQVSEIGPLPLSPIPHPRSGHRAVATDSDLWIFGGFHPSARNNSPHMFNEVQEIFSSSSIDPFLSLSLCLSYGDSISPCDNGN